MSEIVIELVFFPDCPHVDEARRNLRQALIATGREAVWVEWDLTGPKVPDRVRRFGSPTVLVGGEDVTGAVARAEGMACRSDAIPDVAGITGKLQAAVR